MTTGPLRKRSLVTYEALVSLLHYVPDTGAFYWRETRSHRLRGSVAGAVDARGYRRITIAKNPFLAHRLAWFYVHKQWPIGHIDHINRDKLDNRLVNLRDVTTSENQLNRGAMGMGPRQIIVPEYKTWTPATRPTELTAEIVRRFLVYIPESGQFIWKLRAGKFAPGARAGYQMTKENRWMIRITVGGKQHRCYAARLAWLYVHGRHPEGMIDHINGDPTDDRIANLREATQSQNLTNMRRREKSKSGFKGVSQHRKKWKVMFAGKYLGSFATPEEGHVVYMEYVTRLRGEFARAA